MTKKQEQVICPVCGSLVVATSSPYYESGVCWCDECGAKASTDCFKHGYIDSFMEQDCQHCRLNIPVPLAVYCAHGDKCLKRDCCHFPCCCECVGDEESRWCKKERVPFEIIVQNLLVAILRTLKNQ